MDFKNLNTRQLKQVILEANDALSNRRKIEKALIEIQRTIKKYKLSKDELEIALSSLQSSKGAAPSRPKAARRKVSPKYQSQDGSKNWTGRGRTPGWVVEICQTKGLTVKKFKTDPRFLINPDDRSGPAITKRK